MFFQPNEQVGHRRRLLKMRYLYQLHVSILLHVRFFFSFQAWILVHWFRNKKDAEKWFKELFLNFLHWLLWSRLGFTVYVSLNSRIRVTLTLLVCTVVRSAFEVMYKCANKLNLLCAFLDISLQPYIDTRAGTLDTWPAHALGPSPPDLNPISATKQTNEFMPKGVHKPKFLEQLEAFLQKELRSLDCAEMIPSERRLQVSMTLQEELIWKPFLIHWLQSISIRFLFLKLQGIGHLWGWELYNLSLSLD